MDVRTQSQKGTSRRRSAPSREFIRQGWLERHSLMDHWEYRKFEIMLEGKEYIARYENNTSMQGWDTIMDHWTEHGWELLSLAPLESNRISMFSDNNYRVTRFLAVWKRRKAIQEQ